MASTNPTTLADLPTELLLAITEELDTQLSKWSLALAVPTIPQLMIPVLNRLDLFVHRTQRDGVLTMPMVILAFLYAYPEYAEHIRSVDICLSTDSTELHLPDIRLEYLESNGHQIPWLANWTRERHKIRTNRAFSSEIFKELALSWSSLEIPPAYEEQELVSDAELVYWELAVLLAMGTRIYNVNVSYTYEPEKTASMDLGRVALLGLAPAFRCFRQRGQGLVSFRVVTPYYTDVDEFLYRDKQLATLLSTAFILPRIQNLQLRNLVESICDQGEWALYTGVVVDQITVENCRLRGRSFQRLLHAVNGLQRLNGNVKQSVQDGNVVQSVPEMLRRPDPTEIMRGIRAGLTLHRQTLQSLYLYDFPGDLSTLTQLKRLTITSKAAFPHTPLFELLPQSLHTLTWNWWIRSAFGWVTGLQALASNIKACHTFPHLRHIYRAFPLEEYQYVDDELYDGDRQIIQNLASVGVEYCDFPQPIYTTVMSCKWPLDEGIASEFCMGECGKQRRDGVKDTNFVG